MAEKIQILPEEVIGKIAAGEVVERPSSIVKELVENSLDAGASSVTIETKRGGKNYIRVTDDGTGMSRVDAELCLKRHATSKIRKLEDLQSIRTLGFRGEALPSIAQVAKVVLVTREKESPVGYQVKVDGDSVEIEEAGCSPGTTVTVTDLFYNFPARLKFLKTDATEASQITRLVENFALAFPEVSFQLIQDGKSVIKTLPRGQTPLERIASLYGYAVVENLLPLEFENRFLKIFGFVTKPSFSYANRDHQSFFVNRRTVFSRLISHAVWEGYRGFIAPHRHAGVFLYVDIDPLLVDVNVHPTKKEVRFTNEPLVHTIIMQTIKEALCKQVELPGGKRESADYGPIASQKRGVKEAIEDYLTKKQGWRKSISGEELFQTKKFVFPEADKQEKKLLGEEREEIVPLGQVDDVYIVAKGEDAIIILDQHAAWERVLYEELLEEYGRGQIASQGLLFPVHLQLPPRNLEIAKKHTEFFSNLGFLLEYFGGNSFLVKAVPHIFGREVGEKFLVDLIDDISSEVSRAGDRKISDISSDIFKIMACRGAIMAGERLESDEMKEVIRRLSKCRLPHICPHGRPTMFKLTRDELDRKFNRKSDSG